MDNLRTVDLFCGIGGLSYGLQMAGIPVGAGIDYDSTCQYAYEKNCQTEFVHGDITTLRYSDISSYFGDSPYRILAGCAPCQPFSTHTTKLRDARSADNRRHLLRDFLRVIWGGKPEIVVMENVPPLRRKKVYVDFKGALQTMGYHVADGVLNCADVGVPQRRRRLVLLASLLGNISLPKKASRAPVTVRDAIGHLPTLTNGGTNAADPLHTCSRLSPLNLKRIRASVPGGTWRDWPEELMLECHKRPSGRGYGGVYGRMEWDCPSPTLTTRFYTLGTGRYGHPEQDRGLSVREGLILHSFPEDYNLTPSGATPTLSVLGRHIGNAVPPLLGKALGTSIIEHIERYASN